MTSERRTNAMGLGTAIAMVAAVVAVLAWLGFASPAQTITREDAERRFESKETAMIVHNTITKALDVMSLKLDALVAASGRAQAKLEELERKRDRARDR